MIRPNHQRSILQQRLMPTPPEIISLDQLSTDPAAALAALQTSHNPMRIVDGGEGVAVIMRPGHFERLRHDLDLLKHLLAGEREISDGRARDLESVIAASDKLIERKSLTGPEQ
jgi:hypothetical protein